MVIMDWLTEACEAVRCGRPLIAGVRNGSLGKSMSI